MEISLISIGNSKGIRLPKALIEQYGLQDSIELILEKGFIILRPRKKIREGWEKAFSKMHEQGDDKLLIDDVFNEEDFEEWN